MTYKRIPRRKAQRSASPADAARHVTHRDGEIHNEGKPDEMQGFKPGPGNTGSMDGHDDTGRKQVNHKI